MSRPGLQGLPPLGREVVTLINTGYALQLRGLMGQKLVGNDAVKAHGSQS